MDDTGEGGPTTKQNQQARLSNILPQQQRTAKKAANKSRRNRCAVAPDNWSRPSRPTLTSMVQCVWYSYSSSSVSMTNVSIPYTLHLLSHLQNREQKRNGIFLLLHPHPLSPPPQLHNPPRVHPSPSFLPLPPPTASSPPALFLTLASPVTSS